LSLAASPAPLSVPARSVYPACTTHARRQQGCFAAVTVRSAAHGQEDSDGSSRGTRAGRAARRGDGPGARAAATRRAGQVRFLSAVALLVAVVLRDAGRIRLAGA